MDTPEPITNKQLAEKAYDNDTLLSAAGRLADLLSHFSYAEKELHSTGVNRPQRTADFITCINDMLKFYGAVPKTILCDNLKTAVSRACKYEPVFTEMCNQLSEHYQTTFSAARPYSPRDKAMVERAVNIVYSHIYAPLRNHVFFSIEELQLAMQAPLITLNDKPYKNTVYSRQYYYE